MVDVRVGEHDRVDILGSMPAWLRLVNSRPVCALGRFTVLMPVSNRASLSPVLITSAFWSSTTLSVGRK